jgi:hypothetical protein
VDALGSFTPNFHELGLLDVDAGQLPLHVKNVGVVDIGVINRLAEQCVNSLVREFWHRSRLWLTEEGLKGVPVLKEGDKIEWARLSQGDIDKMIAAGHARYLRRGEVPRGTVKMFAVAETFKRRRRAIKHTEFINEVLGKSSLQQLKLIGPADVARSVHDGDFCIALDASAWFDQFAYAKEMQDRYCFRAPNGRLAMLTRLAMGQRQAVETAHGAMCVIADFETGCRVLVYIDNVMFVGSKEEVIEAARTFVMRCKQARVTLNEIDVKKFDPNNRGLLESLAKQRQEFLGIDCDFANKTVAVGEKTMRKLAAVWSVRESWTHRNFMGHISLLLYSSRILRFNVAAFHPTMDFVRSTARTLQADEKLWDRRIDFPADLLDELQVWTQGIMINEPKRVNTPQSEGFEYIIVTDACGEGYGAVCMRVPTQEISVIGDKWEHDFPARFRHSTVAEAEGMRRALHLLPKQVDGKVLVLTDSSTAFWAARKGYSRSPYVNYVMAVINHEFEHVDLSVEHVGGTLNIADALSRAVETRTVDELGQALRSLIGIIASRKQNAKEPDTRSTYLPPSVCDGKESVWSACSRLTAFAAESTFWTLSSS